MNCGERRLPAQRFGDTARLLRASAAAMALLIVPSRSENRRSVRRMRWRPCKRIPMAEHLIPSLLTLLALAVPTDGQTLPGTYALNAATATPTGWAQNWTAQLAGAS